MVVGLPVQTPWVDVRSIGAGGGYIRYLVNMKDMPLPPDCGPMRNQVCVDTVAGGAQDADHRAGHRRGHLAAAGSRAVMVGMRAAQVADCARHEFLHPEHAEELKKDANQQKGFTVVPGA